MRRIRMRITSLQSRATWTMSASSQRGSKQQIQVCSLGDCFKQLCAGWAGRATLCLAKHYSASLHSPASAPACGTSALLSLDASGRQMRTASSPAGMQSSSSSARASRATPLPRCRPAGAAAVAYGLAVNCSAQGVPGSAAASLLVQPLWLSRVHASVQRGRRCGAWRTARGAAS